MRDKHLLLAFFLLFLGACEDPLKMFPDYQIGEPRIIALKVSEPELTLDARPTMRLLIGGETFSQESDLPVLWLVPVESSDELPPDLLAYLTTPYRDAFSFPIGMTVGTLLSQEPTLQKTFDKNGWVDLPIFATITINGKNLSVMKTVRVTQTPRHSNPEITFIRVVYKDSEDALIEKVVEREGTFILPQSALSPYLGLDPETVSPSEQGNDLLVFRWQFNEDPSYATGLRFCDADCPSNEYLGSDRVTPITKEILIDFTNTRKKFSISPPENDITLMFYLVVRDRSSKAESVVDNRYGLDFTTLKLVLTKQ